jgi:hypothetical protein
MYLKQLNKDSKMTATAEHVLKDALGLSQVERVETFGCRRALSPFHLG